MGELGTRAWPCVSVFRGAMIWIANSRHHVTHACHVPPLRTTTPHQPRYLLHGNNEHCCLHCLCVRARVTQRAGRTGTEST